MLLSPKTFWRDLEQRNTFFIYHIVLIVIFTMIYYYTAPKYGTESDKESYKTWEDCLYYTCMTHFTIGLGDIAPKSNFLRGVTIIQVMSAFTLMNL